MAPRVGTVAAVLSLLAALTGCTTVRGNPVPAWQDRPAAATTYTAPSTAEPRTHTPTYPTREPLVPAAIDRVFQVYMNGLANHDMLALSSASCPRLRHTLLGFALHGYFVGRWELLPYEIPPEVEHVTVQARLTRLDVDTGYESGEVVYSWNVERDGQDYYVCGWLNYQDR